MKLARRDHPGTLRQKETTPETHLASSTYLARFPLEEARALLTHRASSTLAQMAQREVLVAAFDHTLPLSSGSKRSGPAMPMFRHAYRATPRADNRGVCVALK